MSSPGQKCHTFLTRKNWINKIPHSNFNALKILRSGRIWSKSSQKFLSLDYKLGSMYLAQNFEKFVLKVRNFMYPILKSEFNVADFFVSIFYTGFKQSGYIIIIFTCFLRHHNYFIKLKYILICLFHNYKTSKLRF